jgi:hypothetical protein
VLYDGGDAVCVVVAGETDLGLGLVWGYSDGFLPRIRRDAHEFTRILWVALVIDLGDIVLMLIGKFHSWIRSRCARISFALAMRRCFQQDGLCSLPILFNQDGTGPRVWGAFGGHKSARTGAHLLSCLQ